MVMVMMQVIEWLVTLVIDVAIKLWIASEKAELRMQPLDCM